MDSRFTKTLSKITFQLFLFLGIFAHTWWKLGNTEYFPMSFLIIQSLLIYLIVTAVVQTIVGTFQSHQTLLGVTLAILYSISIVVYFFVPQLIYGFYFPAVGQQNRTPPSTIGSWSLQP